MIDRKHIEMILRANGVPPTADDEQIRSVLLSAKWNDNEVDTALTVLKENKNSHETHVDTLHKVFHSDDSLSPYEISSLLGIDMDIPAKQKNQSKVYEGVTVISRSTVVLIASILIAIGSLMYVMYSQKMGPYYEPAQTSPQDVPATE